MKKTVIILFLLAAAILGAYHFYVADPNIVDGDYMSSDAYKKLQNDIETERNLIADRETVLRQVVKHMLTKDSVFQKELPYRLDSLALDRVMKAEYRLSIPELRIKPIDISSYNFYGLIIFDHQDYRALLSLIEMPGVYKDLEVGLTTVKDDKIMDTALIGRYQKNISSETYSEIYIGTDKEIQVKVNQYRFYPFEQEKSISYRYHITKDGNIESKIL